MLSGRSAPTVRGGAHRMSSQLQWRCALSMESSIYSRTTSVNGALSGCANRTKQAHPHHLQPGITNNVIRRTRWIVKYKATTLDLNAKRPYSINTNPNPPLGKKNASNDTPSRVAVIGARGYAGQALIDLLNTHPNMILRHVSSRQLTGKKVDNYLKHEVIYEDLGPEQCAELEKQGAIDCWVLALPNDICKPWVDAITEARKAGTDHRGVIIDLSADYRFTNVWTYGLPEITKRSEISKADLISNPGCYATAAQLGIAPLTRYLAGKPAVFGISGYSGAGTKPSPKNDLKLLVDNVIPYGLTDHNHEKEINHNLGMEASFTPHVASWFRGIHLTIHIPLNKTMTSRDIHQIYEDRYADEQLIKVVGEAPQVKAIMNKHGVEIGGFAVHNSGKWVVVCATIDNLLKGAATQCLQNMNLALGYAEYEGIPIV